MQSENRAGKFISHHGGYKYFLPNSLPPTDLKLDDNLNYLLSQADRALAKLDGVAEFLPNPDLFVAMYVKKEALLSSQIEGTQVSLRGVLEFEGGIKPKEDINSINEVINYISAMNFGLSKVENSSLTINLLNQIHEILIENTKGSHKNPGHIREDQNWIGPMGGTIVDATYIPPSPHHLMGLMKDLENFMESKDKLQPLLKIALIHAQFESIHPYLDGNGRMGRLLITYYLCWKGLLSRPILFLSVYLKKNRQEYYELLNNIRVTGNWEAWIEFFLKGIVEVSNDSMETAKSIIELRENLTEKLLDKQVKSTLLPKLVRILFDRPFISVGKVSELLGVSRQTANKIVGYLEEDGTLVEVTGKKSHKRYMFAEFVEIIREGTQLY